MVSYTTENKWHLAEDELPDDCETVLCYDGNTYFTGWWDKLTHTWNDSMWDDVYVQAWQRISMYKGEENDNNQ